MWTKVKKDMLSIIYGDDLVTVGDVVLARNADEKTCKVISMDGQMLHDDDVLGVGYFLARGGFYYVVVTNKREQTVRKRESSFVSKSANNRHYSMINGFNGYTGYAGGDTVKTYYQYKIFDHNFEYIQVGEAQGSSYGFRPEFCVPLFGKLIDVCIEDNIIRESRSVAFSY